MAKKIFTDESLATLVDETKSYVDSAVSTKANSSHTHSISNVTNLQSSLDAKVPTSRTVNGKALSSNISLSASDVGAAASSHTHSSYVNQNAFSNVKVGSTTVAADTTTDTLEIAAGTGISVAGDATNDKVTITNSGVRSIATGRTNGTISVNTNGTSANVAVKGLGSAAYTASTAYDAAGTATTKADAALASAKAYTNEKISDLLDGATDTTLDSIKELADAIKSNDSAIDALNTVAGTKASASDLTSHTGNKSNPHGVTLSQLGVTATAAEVNKMDGVTATTTELNYCDGVTSNIQTQLNGKAASSHTHSTYATKANPVFTGTISLGRKSGSTSGTGSMALGDTVTASGLYSFAVGGSATASGSYSAAIGNGVTASGNYSHAIGSNTIASGYASFAAGQNTKASGESQFVIGERNIEDTDGTYAFIIGNGNTTTSANIHTVDWSGNAWYAGNITNDGTVYFNSAPYVKNSQFYNSYNSNGNGVCLIGINSSNNIQVGVSGTGAHSGSTRIISSQASVILSSGDYDAYLSTSGSFYPNSDSTQSLGTSSNYWGNAYVDNLYIKNPGKTTNTSTTSTDYPILKLNASSKRVLAYSSSSSSKRFKCDIIEGFTNPTLNPENLYDVKLYQYKYKDGHLEKGDQREGMDLYGFIVEDLVEHYPTAVDLDSEGRPTDWNKAFLIPAMLKLIQDQKKQIDTLESRLKDLEEKLNA